MKSLLFLLILDFSGSMYQSVNKEIKYQIVQQNVDALLSAADKGSASQSAFLVFGLNAHEKCSDIAFREMPTQQIPHVVHGFRPAAYSKTPLADSIRRATDITIRRKAKRVVIFSDGADSCGKDPCRQLVRSNAKLAAAHQVMEMTFIGIDLKSAVAQFACFKKSLSNIHIAFSDIENSFQVEQVLRDVVNSDNGKVKKPFGQVEVSGAPAAVQFTALPAGQKEIATWLGAYKQPLKQGSYSITSNFPGTQAVAVRIEQEQEKSIYWADFFKNPRSQFIDQDKGLTFLLTPLDQTKAAHRKVQSMIVSGALLAPETERTTELPFGEWSVEILSPPWLRLNGGKRTIVLAPNETQHVNFFELFSLYWEPVPDPSQRHVVKIGAKERYFIQGEIKNIPMCQGAQVQWLTTLGQFTP